MNPNQGDQMPNMKGMNFGGKQTGGGDEHKGAGKMMGAHKGDMGGPDPDDQFGHIQRQMQMREMKGAGKPMHTQLQERQFG